MNALYEFGEFVRKLGIRARFGRLSRAPLHLLRLELRGEEAECEWMARDSDQWDQDLPSGMRDMNASMQALEDAIAVRELLFCAMPKLSRAAFRIYRQSGGESPELIIAGVVSREEEIPSTVSSLAMRAKLCGLRFWMDNGQLRELQLE